MRVFRNLLTDESGATFVEYGILVMLIALVALVGVRTLGSRLSALFTTTAGSV